MFYDRKIGFLILCLFFSLKREKKKYHKRISFKSSSPPLPNLQRYTIHGWSSSPPPLTKKTPVFEDSLFVDKMRTSGWFLITEVLKCLRSQGIIDHFRLFFAMFLQCCYRTNISCHDRYRIKNSSIKVRVEREENVIHRPS